MNAASFFGTLALEDGPTVEIDDLIGLCSRVDLPATREGVGAE